MTDLAIRPVHSRRDRRRFLEFPCELYRHDPQWVPPLWSQQRELLGFRRHPFYRTASAQAFLAEQGSALVGRILAIHNQAYLDRFPQDPCGFIGFFESIHDTDVSAGLFDAARQWLRDRGQTVVRGPANPSHNYDWGLLVQGFDRSPTFMMTYNPDYYVHLWESYGFTKAQDLYSFIGRKEDLSSIGKKVFHVSQEATRRFGIHVRRLDRRKFARDVEIFLKVYNESNMGNWGHIPMSEAEVTKASRGLRFLIVPEMARIAEVDGKPVGAVLGLLDFNPLIQQIGGRLFPFGFLKLLWKRRSIRRIRIVSANVVPAYQRWGIGVVLTAHLVPSVITWPIEEGEFSWVLESNELSRRTLERGNLPVEKIHRIYEIRDP